MSGNVYEWCWDWDGGDISNSTAADGATSGSDRVFRGGSWFNYANLASVCIRYANFPSSCSHDYGFRVVRASSN